MPELARRTLLQGAVAASAAGPMVAAAISAPSPRPANVTAAQEQRVAISYITEAVDEGTSMVIVGEGFGPQSKVWLHRPARDTAATVKQQFGTTVAPLPATPIAGAVAAQIVGTIKPQTIVAGQIGYPTPAAAVSVHPTVVWVVDGADTSQPYVVNKPELFFTEIDVAVPGETFRIFGRNFQPTAETTGANYDFPIALTNTGTGAVFWAQLVEDEGQPRMFYKPYVINMRLPADLPTGDYEVRVHTLVGAGHGWSNALRFSVVTSRSLVRQLGRADLSDQGGAAPKRRLRVDTIRSLDADKDNWKRIQDSLISMGREGGITILPPGTYPISKTLEIPDGVVLQGAGIGATTLVPPLFGNFESTFPIKKLFTSPAWIPGFVGDYTPYVAPHQPLIWISGSGGISDLAVHASARDFTAILIGSRDPEHVIADPFIKRVDIRVRANSLRVKGAFTPTNAGIHVVSSTTGLVVTDSTVFAHEPISMYAARHPHRYAHIAHNTFSSYPHNDSNIGMLMAWTDSVFEENTIVAGARALISQMGMARVIMIGNRISEIGGRGNAAEILMSEAGNLIAEVAVVSASESKVKTTSTLPDKAATATSSELYAHIVSGRGYGQFRRIVKSNGTGEIEVSPPWTVVPDAQSKIDILSNGSVRNLTLNNWLSNSRGYLQPFYGGTAFENIVAGNDIRSCGGLSLWTGFTRAGQEHKNSAAYNLVYGNQLVSSDAINLFGGNADVADRLGGAFANTIRRNQVWSRATPSAANQYYNIWFSRAGEVAPDLEGAINIVRADTTVVESNYIFQTPRGVLVRGGRGNVVRYNRMDRVDQRLMREGDADSFFQAPPFESPY